MLVLTLHWDKKVVIVVGCMLVKGWFDHILNITLLELLAVVT